MREDIIKYEWQYWSEFSVFLELAEPVLYAKTQRIAKLCESLGGLFGFDDDEFLLASRYANITLMPLSGAMYDKHILENNVRHMVKRHPFLASEFLASKGLDRAAEIVLHHHEFPNGKGYLKSIAFPVESNLLHIADLFVGMTTPRADRIGGCLTRNEAIGNIKNTYSNMNIPAVLNINSIIELLSRETF